jgi:hypothetical protein
LRARIVSRPLGGVVKTYGGINRNQFDGGLLIGDAGSFVDPLTGEGITHGMESAILALPTLVGALERGRFEAADLAGFDETFHRYFDPSMQFLELAAALISNRHMSEFWLRVGSHGNEEAARDPLFAQIAGAIFGGPALQPLSASTQMWLRLFARYGESLLGAGARSDGLSHRFAEDIIAFRQGWTRSQQEHPDWHAAWLQDVATRFTEVQKTIWTAPNPRPEGVFRFIGMESARDAPGGQPATPVATAELETLVRSGVRTLLELGFAALAAPRSAPPTDDQPRRRWRIKP